MVEPARATGSALDATVAIGEASRGELEEALVAARAREIAEEGPNRIRSIERKIERLERQLGEAREWLAAEKAEQGVK